ncbi:MAG: elongation factor P [Deltaproteobacteria bacterium]|nr:elongation factor P [Deltaproteobacteria bacterium]
MLQATQLRSGMIINYEGKPYQIMEAQHRTPGNKRGFMQVKMRNLINGEQTEAKFGSSDKVEKVSLETKKMQFLYREGDDFHLMDQENFEQIHLSLEQMGDAVYFLLPEAIVDVCFYEGKSIGVTLPKVMELTVTETEPELKGATATAQYKPATLETGAQIKVPPFIKVGDKIKVDTENHEYMTRV